MAVLAQMGINGSIFIQIAIFIFTITILTQFIFKPFALAEQERKSRTKGGEELATEILKRAASLKSDFESQAKSLHQEIGDIYFQARSSANAESEKIINAAKLDSQIVLKKSRDEIQQSLYEAQELIKGQTKEISMLIANKVLGKK
ncbi:MAG TPA: ATP synthase F0 subunit B [Pseudobdellovibrionaceae bacterium]|nr:ATP synthase F0 subunit B [Pseudobdellovibrionaceae bacterium]